MNLNRNESIESGSEPAPGAALCNLRNGASRWKIAFFISLLACFTLRPSWAQQPENLALLEKSFANPPDDCRIMMRWWWFGPAVTKPELQRELEQMKAEGIGGF